MSLTTIPTDFGSGGANLNPTGNTPTLRTVLDEHKTAIETLQSAPSTTTTASPISGNGSSGTPITIADGAIPISKFANVATQTFMGRKTAGTGVPESMTLAQSRLLLQPEYFAAVSGASVGNLVLSGMDGDTDGDYEISGQIISGHSGATFVFEPNNQNANLKAFAGDYLSGGASGTVWAVVGKVASFPQGVVAGDVFNFWGHLTIQTGRIRSVNISGFMDTTTDDAYHMEGIWTDTTTNLTSLELQSSQSDGLADGSWFRAVSLGRS